MTIRGDLLKKGIIARLQEYDAYIDDELPDYILVMVANKKTNEQIKEDLQLFLTDDTDPFIEWLETVLNNPSLLEPEDHSSEGTPYPSSPSSTGSISPQRHALKRQRSPDHPSQKTTKMSSPPDKSKSIKRTNDQGGEGEDLPRRGVHRIMLPPDPLEKKSRRIDSRDQPWNTKDQDLRSLIRRRQAETISDEEEEGILSVGVSSVVQLAPKKERPKRPGGTGRLLQKAISDIHGVSSSSSSKSSTRRGRKRSKSGEKRDKRVSRELESDVLELHQHEEEGMGSDRDKSVVLPVNEPVLPVNKVITSVEVKKKSIRERLDSTPERGDLTEAEVAALSAVKEVLPPKLIDLRQILKNRKQKNTADSDGTRFIVTLDSNKEEVVKVSSSSRIDEELPSSKSLPERCRFWPNCKNGDSCPYHHPTVPCRLFPKCKYGQKCCFVHPVCKYDGRCTNPTCYYLHTVPKQTTPAHIQSNVLPMTSPFSSVSPYTFGRTRGRTKFPTKSALSWTPGKSTVNERKFAVPESQASNMQV